MPEINFAKEVGVKPSGDQSKGGDVAEINECLNALHSAIRCDRIVFLSGKITAFWQKQLPESSPSLPIAGAIVIEKLW